MKDKNLTISPTFLPATNYHTRQNNKEVQRMQQIQIAKRQINYHHTLKLTYNIKITKTTYTNKQNKKTYTRYKIRIPEEIQQLLQNTDTLYFNKEEDNKIHITTKPDNNTIHKSKIQKNTYHNRTDYVLNLSKKIFNIKEKTYLSWKITVENNKVKDSTIELH